MAAEEQCSGFPTVANVMLKEAVRLSSVRMHYDVISIQIQFRGLRVVQERMSCLKASNRIGTSMTGVI